VRAERILVVAGALPGRSGGGSCPAGSRPPQAGYNGRGRTVSEYQTSAPGRSSRDFFKMEATRWIKSIPCVRLCYCALPPSAARMIRFSITVLLRRAGCRRGSGGESPSNADLAPVPMERRSWRPEVMPRSGSRFGLHPDLHAGLVAHRRRNELVAAIFTIFSATSSSSSR